MTKEVSFKQMAEEFPVLKQEEKYNGWTNRETWLVALWLSNDEGLSREVNELLSHTTDKDYEKNYMAHTTRALEDFMRGLLERSAEGAMAIDFITQPLNYVNWAEIVRNWND